MTKADEPCTCGSGKKYGECCGASEEPASEPSKSTEESKTCSCGSGKPAAQCCKA